MPFGLCNATATFQRLMAHALIGVTKKYGNLVMCYVDDVVIATPTLEDHIERLDEVFACMKRSGLKCKPSKCEILKDSIKYLGRMVDKHGIRPDPDAVEAVLTWKSPKTEHQLMSFLGFANYYREFTRRPSAFSFQIASSLGDPSCLTRIDSAISRRSCPRCHVLPPSLRPRILRPLSQDPVPIVWSQD